MKRNESFVLVKIAEVPYILPFGQMIADQKRGIRTNDTGAFIWGLLGGETDEEGIFSACARHFQAAEDELGMLKEDIRDFIRQLSFRGMLERTEASEQANFYGAFCIGGLVLNFYGPRECFSENFESFRSSSSPVDDGDQKLTVKVGAPQICANGVLLLRNPELTVIDAGGKYVFTFPSARGILEAAVDKNGKEAVVCCMPPFDEHFRENLFHAIRTLFLYLAWCHDMLILHSASLLYRERVWLFSGHSGMGKSTHTNLWHKLLGVPLINGDLNLFARQDGMPVVKGIPWCGTSGICDVGTHRLGGIILLNQHPEDEVVALSSDEKRLLVAQRIISPTWTEELFLKNLDLVDKMADDILICKLRCTMNDSAVEVMKAEIDRYLSGF